MTEVSFTVFKTHNNRASTEAMHVIGNLLIIDEYQFRTCFRVLFCGYSVSLRCSFQFLSSASKHIYNSTTVIHVQVQ